MVVLTNGAFQGKMELPLTERKDIMAQKKKDPVIALLEETVKAIKKEKSPLLGLAAGAAVGFLCHDKLNQYPKIRDSILGAVGGETIGRLLGDGKEEDDENE